MPNSFLRDYGPPVSVIVTKMLTFVRIKTYLALCVLIDLISSLLCLKSNGFVFVFLDP